MVRPIRRIKTLARFFLLIPAYRFHKTVVICEIILEPAKKNITKVISEKLSMKANMPPYWRHMI